MIDKKTDNLLELEYLANSEILNNRLIDWSKARPENKELKDCVSASVNIAFYVNRLNMDRQTYNKVISDYRLDKIRAIERARRAEERIEELEKELAVYKKREELGL